MKAKTEDSFIEVVLESLFVQGVNCTSVEWLSTYAMAQRRQSGGWPDLHSFLCHIQAIPGMTCRPQAPDGSVPSLTAGARDHWLVVHEAGHAIVGIGAGFVLRGVRFYGEHGFPGETGFPDEECDHVEDEDLLRRLIRVDVAGNIAEMQYPRDRKPEGCLSALYSDLTPGERPSDFCSADERALHLGGLLRQKAGIPLVGDQMWDMRHSILKQAESEAEAVLRQWPELLMQLANRLRRGPITGTDVLGILKTPDLLPT